MQQQNIANKFTITILSIFSTAIFLQILVASYIIKEGSGVQSSIIYIIIFGILILGVGAYLIYKSIKSNVINPISNLSKISNSMLKDGFEVDEFIQSEIFSKFADLYSDLTGLQLLSPIDSLTKIPNRHSFDKYIEQEWAHCLRSQLPVTIMIIDIDNFKEFNNTYGISEGDKALYLVAQSISNSFKRKSDFFARYEDESFVAVLPSTTNELIRILTEQIRQNVEDLNIKNESVNTILTVSLGVSTAIPEIDTLHIDLVKAANEALNRAKKSGKNCVVTDFHDERM